MEDIKQLSKLEIIAETKKYYSEDTSRRSMFNSSCMYNTREGNHCAVGRCLLEKYQKKGCDLKGNSNVIGDLVSLNKKSNLDAMLKPEYRGYSVMFWLAIQRLHDNNTNWDAQGITENGEKAFKELIEQSSRY